MQSAMIARGIRKQIVLASHLGVNESAVSRWQQGAGLSLDHATKLCEALDISLDWLILGRGHMDQHHATDSEKIADDAGPSIELLPISIANSMRFLIGAIVEVLATTAPK
ncbi:helix-turn-helix domain-containing protein [Acidisoma silvae]|uniref:Helix-turn-helix domain-containing protein n=1 Tax=Acidisoma silvae TaxID=2802396 RepID=A0A963YUC1_9PROT|nr:helix-turn-helix domain containing protein [Acidisoma silvae]MCB8877221.1 helix-turn-helix domain-containing protein [Acidisoma silvae]